MFRETAKFLFAISFVYFFVCFSVSFGVAKAEEVQEELPENIPKNTPKNTQETDGLREMVIKGVAFDRAVNSPVVVLSDKTLKKEFPIWIGMCEARSIELGVSNIIPPRPLTYDFFAALVRTLKAKVEKVVIVDLRDNVFYAEVVLSVDGQTVKIDARPSDAIALAARMGAPIYITNSVAKKSANEGNKTKRDI